MDAQWRKDNEDLVDGVLRYADEDPIDGVLEYTDLPNIPTNEAMARVSIDMSGSEKPHQHHLPFHIIHQVRFFYLSLYLSV